MQGMSHNTDICTLLIAQENAIASLYDAFHACDIQTSPLWKRMAGEERAHASVIETLRERSQMHDVKLDTRQYRAPAIISNLNFMDRQTRRARAEEITDIMALSISVSLENSLIEQNFFRVFQFDGSWLKTEFRALEAHTRAHASEVATMREIMRSSSGEMSASYLNLLTAQRGEEL